MVRKTKHKVTQGIIFKAFDVETLGRGLKRMDNACKAHHISWDYCKYNFGFSFTFKRKTYEHNYNNLSIDAKKLITFMKQNKNVIENSKIAMSILDKKERATHQVIKELIDNNIIERVGSNKTGYWSLIK